MMRIVIQSLTLMSCFLLLSNTHASVSRGTSQDIEVMEIQGHKTSAQLKKNASKAEIAFLEAFNVFNQIPEFKFICAPVAKVGSHIKKKSCEQMFVKNERNILIQQIYNQPGKIDFNKIPSDGQVLLNVKTKKKKSLIYMEELIVTHPPLMHRFLNYAQAKYQFENSLPE